MAGRIVRMRHVILTAGALLGEQRAYALFDSQQVQAVQDSLTRQVNVLLDKHFPGQGFDAAFVRASLPKGAQHASSKRRKLAKRGESKKSFWSRAERRVAEWAVEKLYGHDHDSEMYFHYRPRDDDGGENGEEFESLPGESEEAKGERRRLHMLSWVDTRDWSTDAYHQSYDAGADALDWAAGLSWTNVGSAFTNDGLTQGWDDFADFANRTIIEEIRKQLDPRKWKSHEEAHQWSWNNQPGLETQPSYPYCCEAPASLRKALDEQCEYLHNIEGFFICGVSRDIPQEPKMPVNMTDYWSGVGKAWKFDNKDCHPGQTFMEYANGPIGPSYYPWWLAPFPPWPPVAGVHKPVYYSTSDFTAGLFQAYSLSTAAECQRLCKRFHNSKVFMWKEYDPSYHDDDPKCMCAKDDQTLATLVEFTEKEGQTFPFPGQGNRLPAFSNFRYQEDIHKMKWALCDTEIALPSGSCKGAGLDHENNPWQCPAFGPCESYCGLTNGVVNYCCQKGDTAGGCAGWIGSDDANGLCVPAPSVPSPKNQIKVREVFDEVVETFSWFLDQNGDGVIDKPGVNFALGCHYTFVFGNRGTVANLTTDGVFRDYIVPGSGAPGGSTTKLREVPAIFGAIEPSDSKYDSSMQLEHLDYEGGEQYVLSDSSWRPDAIHEHGITNAWTRDFVFWGHGKCSTTGTPLMNAVTNDMVVPMATSIGACAAGCLRFPTCAFFAFGRDVSGLQTELQYNVAQENYDASLNYCTLFAAAETGGDCLSSRDTWIREQLLGITTSGGLPIAVIRSVYKRRGGQAPAEYGSYRFVPGLTHNTYCGANAVTDCALADPASGVANCYRLPSSTNVSSVAACRDVCNGDARCNFFSFFGNDTAPGNVPCATFDFCPAPRNDLAFPQGPNSVYQTARIITMNKNPDFDTPWNATANPPVTWTEYQSIGERVFQYIARAYDKIGYLRFDIPGYTTLNVRQRYVKTPSTQSMMQLFVSDVGYSIATSFNKFGFCSDINDPDYVAASCYGTDHAVVDWLYLIWLFEQNQGKGYAARLNGRQITALNDMTYSGFPVQRYGKYGFGAKNGVGFSAQTGPYVPGKGHFIGIKLKEPGRNVYNWNMDGKLCTVASGVAEGCLELAAQNALFATANNILHTATEAECATRCQNEVMCGEFFYKVVSLGIEHRCTLADGSCTPDGSDTVSQHYRCASDGKWFDTADLCNAPYDWLGAAPRPKLFPATSGFFTTTITYTEVDPVIDWFVAFLSFVVTAVCIAMYCLWKIWGLMCRCCCAACVCCVVVVDSSDSETSSSSSGDSENSSSEEERARRKKGKKHFEITERMRKEKIANARQRLKEEDGKKRAERRKDEAAKREDKVKDPPKDKKDKKHPGRNNSDSSFEFAD